MIPKVQFTLVEMAGYDTTLGVAFTDLDGKVVSLSFDGRYPREDCGAGSKRSDYSVYSDCPIIDGAGDQMTNAHSLQVIRNLRDALINLNLGD